MGALLIATEIDKGIGVADDALPVAFEQGFELGYVLQDDRGHDVAGSHGRLQAGITVRQGDVCKLVEHQAYRHRQAAHVYLVRLVIQLLKCLGIEHTDKEIKAHVIAVRDYTENSLLAFSQLGKLQIILVGNVLYLSQRERGQPDGGRHKDAFCRLARRLLENVILPHGNMIRLFFLQRLEKQIQRGLEIVVVLFRPAVLDHGEHHFHGLLIGRRLMEKVKHKGGVEGNFGFLPKGVILACVLRRGALNEVVDQPEHIGVLADIAERVIAVGMARLDQIEHLDDIALLQKKWGDSADELTLRIGADKARIGKEQIWLYDKAGLSRAAAADYDLKQIPHVLPPVEAHAQVLGKDHVPGRVFVAVLLV